MTSYISNAFSLSMLSFDTDNVTNITVRELTSEQVKQHFDVENAVGHESTAKIMTRLLGVPISVNRRSIKLNLGDKLIVFQLLDRLPEGKVLNDQEIANLNFKWLLVEVRAFHAVEAFIEVKT